MMLAKAASTKTRLNNNTAIVFNDFPLGENADDTVIPKQCLSMRIGTKRG